LLIEKMEIIRIVAIGIITAVCVVILKEQKQETAMLVGIVGSALILLSVIDYFLDIFNVLGNFMDNTGIPSGVYNVIFKIVGIGYITDFAASLVEDTGQKAFSEKILLAGKLIIMVLSLPILTLLFETITGLIG